MAKRETETVGGSRLNGNVTAANNPTSCLDNIKIKRFVPDFVATTPFRVGIARTLAWFDSDPARRLIDPEANARYDRPTSSAHRDDRGRGGEQHCGGSDEVARVAEYGPVPSGVARLLTTTGRAWVRRLYVHPSTGELVAMEAQARHFPPALAELVRLRDQQCRAPYCDAPIRHIDHVIPVRSGGRTTNRNALGLCER